MFLIIELISISALLIGIFVRPVPTPVKLKQLRLAILFLLLFQVIIYVTGSIIFYFIESSLQDDTAATVASSILAATIIISLPASFLVSRSAIKRKYGQ
jgi:Na+/melibiose symporter-like transporter